MQKLSREIIHTMDTPCQIFERVVPNIYVCVHTINVQHWLRSAEKAALQLCKIRKPDWCRLFILAESNSIHQSDSRILQQLQSSFFR